MCTVLGVSGVACTTQPRLHLVGGNLRPCRGGGQDEVCGMPGVLWCAATAHTPTV